MTIMTAPESGVTVRMYRTGLGDCFLLAFRKQDGEPFYMLIDCGIHGQWRGGSARIRKVVDHIRVATNKHIDVAVLSHEHGDHASGFYLARSTFEAMTIDEAWFGWTEDPENELARRLDRHRALMMNALRSAQNNLAANDPVAHNVEHLLGFFDVSPRLNISSRDARDSLRDFAKEARYLTPKGRPLTLPNVDKVRVFVLGPPDDEGWLMRARPSSQAGEVYRVASTSPGRPSGDDALGYALMAASDTPLNAAGYSQRELAQPFAGNQRIPADMVRSNKKLYRFFHDHYGFSARHEEAWRQIETDWMNPAESIALKLDSATNNTSLVLAIELQESNRVLLFPGDAQVGNWKSWHESGWDENNGLKPGENISASDLLKRTVLYKVSHHGSHNATLRRQGLEMMTSDELTAMIPVDEEWAYDRKPYPWKMPFHSLYDALVARTQGRILRSDTGRLTPEHADAAWRAFEGRTRVDDLFVELDVPDTES